MTAAACQLSIAIHAGLLPFCPQSQQQMHVDSCQSCTPTETRFSCKQRYLLPHSPWRLCCCMHGIAHVTKGQEGEAVLGVRLHTGAQAAQRAAASHLVLIL